ncbi:MAG: endolytic transglycosylase MltG [Erysipelotrichaceae bacterium]|nr:endolytic transglycosylase MltG [Erysipelotrichaceae bacterium]
MKKAGKIILCIVLFLLLIAGGAFAYAMHSLSLNDYEEGTLFTVNEGDVGRRVFSNLKEDGIIRNDTVAYYYSRLSHPSDFKAGKYHLPKGLDMNSLIDYLSDSTNAYQETVSIRFREDDNLEIMAGRIEEALGISKEDILEYWNGSAVDTYINDYEFLTEDIKGSDIRYALEGYLFPDTYEFYLESSMDDITRRMLDRGEEVYEKYRSDFSASSHSIHEIYTMASIVQYESGTDDQNDMSHVASVFYNRLDAGMPLQSTVTACYGRGLDKEGCHLYGDLYETTKAENAYNTYLFYGLPPGPILCPGEKAIYAALNPTDDKDFYFVGDLCGGSGHNYFAETLAEHELNIERYVSCK